MVVEFIRDALYVFVISKEAMFSKIEARGESNRGLGLGLITRSAFAEQPAVVKRDECS
jgi:hypothetical protein